MVGDPTAAWGPFRSGGSFWKQGTSVRTGGAFDGVIDFDATLRDPKDPLRYAPGMGEANNFGPSRAGDARLAESIDLDLFR